MIYSNGAARFGSEAGLNVRCYKDGLELYANGKMVAALDAATDGNGQMKSLLRVNRILTGKCSEVSSWD